MNSKCFENTKRVQTVQFLLLGPNTFLAFLMLGLNDSIKAKVFSIKDERYNNAFVKGHLYKWESQIITQFFAHSKLLSE